MTLSITLIHHPQIVALLFLLGRLPPPPLHTTFTPSQEDRQLNRPPGDPPPPWRRRECLARGSPTTARSPVNLGASSSHRGQKPGRRLAQLRGTPDEMASWILSLSECRGRSGRRGRGGGGRGGWTGLTPRSRKRGDLVVR